MVENEQIKSARMALETRTAVSSSHAVTGDSRLGSDPKLVSLQQSQAHDKRKGSAAWGWDVHLCYTNKEFN